MHRADGWQAVLASSLRPAAFARRSCTTLGGTMAERSELQCRHDTSKKSIGMNVYQRLMRFAAAGAFARRQSGPSHISLASLRFNGMRCSSPRLRRYGTLVSGVAIAPVFVTGFWRLPPNHRVNRTAHQRRWWVPSALRAPAAGYAER